MPTDAGKVTFPESRGGYRGRGAGWQAWLTPVLPPEPFAPFANIARIDAGEPALGVIVEKLQDGKQPQRRNQRHENAVRGGEGKVIRSDERFREEIPPEQVPEIDQKIEAVKREKDFMDEAAVEARRAPEGQKQAEHHDIHRRNEVHRRVAEPVIEKIAQDPVGADDRRGEP